MKINIYGLSLDEIKILLKPLQIEEFRAMQIVQWLYQKNVSSFSLMTNLPLALRNKLDNRFSIIKPSLIDSLVSKDRQTTKFLLKFDDDTKIETVLMRHKYGNSVCVSSQAGCAMGCVFCASTIHGLTRNLSAGEMLSEVLFINEKLHLENQKVDSIVIMGSGEPLLNYDNIIKFIHLLHELYSINLSYRNITISTSGIVPGIYKLADECLPITLSISLHAPCDDIRSQLMPVNKKYNISELLAATDYYVKKTNKRITYEYILIENLNDTKDCAITLAMLLKNKLASVNLIPVNPVRERNLNRPSPKRITEFEKILVNHHITVTIRREMGSDIQAACGQLRNKHIL